MRTRCPRCQTIFRITPEQLRARGGKVRCGHCQAVFNALETLLEELPPTSVPEPVLAAPEPPRAFEPPPAPEPPAEPESSPEPAPEPEPVIPAEAEPLPEAELPVDSEPVAAEEPEVEAAPAPAAEEPPRDETPEETTLAAREAGLMAAREITETPGYNRWAAGTLASSPLAGLEGEHHRARWPFVLASVVLALGLLLQIAVYFRTELVQRLPGLESAFAAFGVAVPLPRQVDLVSIETSDLQADNSRGLLVLQATLKNRAAYPQAWPALELTLTDTQDAVVARRVLEAPDYLPPKTDPRVFPANSETGLRLWIEAKEVAAAGYRLYVFYP
ncbi:MAG TPA: DUF3426 domain-containing protein [Rhodocyclaceae bacterium]|nr:DUF3426 domain-containing protein [Rhodocyclaceae bacterium]